jgi:hypothetical protein
VSRGKNAPAEVLKLSPITVLRDWSTAKAWHYRELSGQKSDGHPHSTEEMREISNPKDRAVAGFRIGTCVLGFPLHIRDTRANCR